MKIIVERSLVMVLTIAGILAFTAPALRAYNVSYTDGGNWNAVYAQGFSTSLGAAPSPGLANGDAVNLTQFQFFKSGNSDAASDIYLAIFSTMYPNTDGLTTSDGSFVGLSANSIASTASLGTGDAITFTFNNLPLIYGNDYSAIFVNVSGNALTPVLVSALTANYQDTGIDDGSGTYHPTSNYGAETDYQYTTSNFINGGYFAAFGYAGDANFNATLSPVPEPAPSVMLGFGALLLGVLRRRK